ncbi:hypothetical protein BDV38DRAFT_280179 [Aspergillus pseudotamarii]|uniref:Uncharacterized protein n=1 Tax=Aspergillus pseudotamarii TaxID=132259 RepID=A0A5N6SZX5_ASPPS|nr:uncharacterized protein BDV38DRAFT_280179 [Aspergillus pseudotamarii]KAE8140182.1 hypothetical protein BDV38DRAFT_280179 [Aspergillus pseudotamarii]
MDLNAFAVAMPPLHKSFITARTTRSTPNNWPRELDSRTRLHALGMAGLAIQAITFTIVGISWISRINLFRDALTRLPFWLTVTDWLKLVWWAAEDDLVLTAVQAGLFFKARRKARLQTGGETEPLLRDHDEDS